MSVFGHQDFWTVGNGMLFQRAAAAGANPNPVLDLGVIQSANPEMNPEVIQLMDSESGMRVTVDEALSGVEEAYTVTLSNLNMENLALLFMANSPESFTSTQFPFAHAHYVHTGHLASCLDLVGVRQYNLFSIDGIHSTTGTVANHAIDSMTASTNKIALDSGEGDVSLGYSVGDFFIVTGTNAVSKLSPGTYKVLSAAFIAATYTEITVDTTFRAIEIDEAFGAGDGLTITNSSGATIYEPGVDWEVGSELRGYVRIFPSGAIATGNVVIVFTTSAFSGVRLIKPQSALGVIKGTAQLFFSRQNYARETVREMEVSITPSGTSFTVDDFSTMELTFRVLNDLSATDPAGRLLHYQGDVPPLSSVPENVPEHGD